MVIFSKEFGIQKTKFQVQILKNKKEFLDSKKRLF